ncbi:MAG TPA: hypothetical protein VFR23_04095 [Jiangellaceae bacterium]|nr:hypothetical protein [Jiangellaceae bacterium]
MTGLAVAIVVPFVMLAVALWGLRLADRSGQPALRRYRTAHRIGRTLWDRTDGDRWMT